MKRTIILVLCLCLILCGCGSDQSDSPSEKPDSSVDNVRTTQSGTETTVYTIPAPIQYNGSTFSLESVDFYESYSEDSFSYFLYCIVTFDVSKLSEAELHWLTNEDINVLIAYNQSDNGYDFCDMPKIGTLHITDTNKLVYSFAPSNYSAYRDSFGGKDIILTVNVDQEETYIIKGDIESHKENTLFYVNNIPDTLPSSEEIPEPIYSHMVDCISRKNDFINSLY